MKVSLDDPDGKPYDAFVQTKERIKNELLPLIRTNLKNPHSR